MIHSYCYFMWIVMGETFINDGVQYIPIKNCVFLILLRIKFMADIFQCLFLSNGTYTARFIIAFVEKQFHFILFCVLELSAWKESIKSRHPVRKMRPKMQNFEWGLKPLILFLKVVGLDINTYNSKTFHKLLTTLVGISIIVMNVCKNWKLTNLRSEFVPTGSGFLSGDSWTELFKDPGVVVRLVRSTTDAMFFYYVPIAHIIFIIILLFSSNFRFIWTILLKVEKKMKLDRRFYQKCRKQCLLGLLMLFTDFVVYCKKASNMSLRNEFSHQEEKIKNYFFNSRPGSFEVYLWSRLAEIGIRAVFVVFAQIAALFLDELVKHMKNMPMDHNNSVRMESLVKWKCHVDLVYGFIEKLNGSFGLLLLLFSCHDAADAIFELEKVFYCKKELNSNYTYSASDSDCFYDSAYLNVASFVHVAARFLVLLVVSHSVEYSAGGVLGCLFQVKSSVDNIELKGKINTILLQLSEIPSPKITALNIFDPEFPLLLQLGDIALQYGVILYAASLANSKARSENYVACPSNLVSNRCLCIHFLERIMCSPNSISNLRVAMENEKSRLYFYFYVNIPPFDNGEIPPALLGNSATISMHFLCMMNQKLVFHPDALSSSLAYMEELKIELCDLSRTNFTFLNGFRRFKKIEISQSTHITLAKWTTLPRIPSLSIALNKSPIKEWKSDNFPLPVNGFFEANFEYTDLNDSTMDQVLDLFLKSSAHTMRKLGLMYNSLTRIPHKISSFVVLEEFVLVGIPPPFGLGTLQADNPLSNSAKTLSKLDLSKTGVVSIQPGAFGLHSRIKSINLSNNNLTRLESSVFLDILALSNYGATSANDEMIELSPNPWDCNVDLCHLAWLIRDNRPILTRAFNNVTVPKCSNGTSFADLNPEWFYPCH